MTTQNNSKTPQNTSNGTSYPTSYQMTPRTGAPGVFMETMKDIDWLAVRFSKSSLVDSSDGADIFFTLSLGKELGLSPVSSLRAITIINGKACVSAAAMLAIGYRAGLQDLSNCGTTEDSSSFSGKRNAFEAVGHFIKSYDESPSNEVMEAIAKANLARKLFPELLHGITCTEEVRILAASRTQLDTLVEELESVKTKDALDVIALRAMKDLTDEEQARFKPHYRRARERLGLA